MITVVICTAAHLLDKECNYQITFLIVFMQCVSVLITMYFAAVISVWFLKVLKLFDGWKQCMVCVCAYHRVSPYPHKILNIEVLCLCRFCHYFQNKIIGF